MIKRQPQPLWHLLLTGLLVVGAVTVILAGQWQEHARDTAPVPMPATVRQPGLPVAPAPSAHALRESLRVAAAPCLAEVGIWPELVHSEQHPDTLDRIAVRVPGDLPLPVVNHCLSRLVQAAGGRVSRAEETVPGHRVEIRASFDAVVTTVFVLERAGAIRRRTGRIALVIDDFGYHRSSRRQIAGFCALPSALTFAVLPNARPVEDFLQAAAASGHQILLHLPMQAQDPAADPGPDPVTVDLSDEEIRRRVERALQNVPGAVGVNNHMGSLATTDPHVMSNVLQVLETHQLFFLDSRTHPESVGYALACTSGVSAARSDLFIDPVDDREAVEDRLWELADMAARMGSAIGIGHDRLNTLLALQAVLPRLDTRGFNLVPVSQLVH